MFFMHPVLLAVSFSASLAMIWKVARPTLRSTLIWNAVIIIGSACINPLFSHNGETPLLYVNSNAITLEAIAYGAAIGVLLSATMMWCRILQLCMTSDAFYYLFSRISPTFALLLSMTLRFVPLFKEQMTDMMRAQKMTGQAITSGSFPKRLMKSFRVLTMMVTWALEQAIEGADSMRARGYGIGKRTPFSIYIFTKRDRNAFVLLGAFVSLLLAMTLMNYTYYSFYPTFTPIIQTVLSVTSYVMYSVFFFIPLFEEGRLQQQWHKSTVNN